MKGIFKRTSAGLTGKAGEKAREQRKQKRAPTRKRYLDVCCQVHAHNSLM